jgi:hypothetical protein
MSVSLSMSYLCLIPTDLFETIRKYDAGWNLISDLLQCN